MRASKVVVKVCPWCGGTYVDNPKHPGRCKLNPLNRPQPSKVVLAWLDLTVCYTFLACFMGTVLLFLTGPLYMR